MANGDRLLECDAYECYQWVKLQRNAEDNQLGGRVIEEGECLKDWQRRGYACQIDDGYDSDSTDDEDLPTPIGE